MNGWKIINRLGMGVFGYGLLQSNFKTDTQADNSSPKPHSSFQFLNDLATTSTLLHLDKNSNHILQELTYHYKEKLQKLQRRVFQKEENEENHAQECRFSIMHEENSLNETYHYDRSYDDVYVPPPPPPPYSTRSPSRRGSSSSLSPNAVLGTMIGSFALVFLASRSSNLRVHEFLVRHFHCSVINWQSRRYHSVILASFNHATVPHLLFNSIALYSLGSSLIPLMGTKDFLSLYFLSTLASGIASILAKRYLLHDFYRASVGASGGIMGLFGFTACEVPEARFSIIFFPFVSFSAKQFLVALLLFDVAGACRLFHLGFDHFGHLGGVFTGIFTSLSGIYRMGRQRIWD